VSWIAEWSEDLIWLVSCLSWKINGKALKIYSQDSLLLTGCNCSTTPSPKTSQEPWFYSLQLVLMMHASCHRKIMVIWLKNITINTVITFWITVSLDLRTCNKLVILCASYINNRDSSSPVIPRARQTYSAVVGIMAYGADHAVIRVVKGLCVTHYLSKNSLVTHEISKKSGHDPWIIALMWRVISLAWGLWYVIQAEIYVKIKILVNPVIKKQTRFVIGIPLYHPVLWPLGVSHNSFQRVSAHPPQ